MIKIITYGTFDLLHQGHINLLRRAKELGDYLIVGVTSDNFDRNRGKLNVKNNVIERIDAVRATGYADEIIIEDYIGQKIDDIQRYNIDIFAIGSDWQGKFDYLNEYCKVIYLKRTEGISSTMLRKRFIPETKVMTGIKVVSVLDINKKNADAFKDDFNLNSSYSDFDDFIKEIDAVYIASPHLTHYDYSKRALEKGKHVLCEIPFVLSSTQASELYRLAESKGLVILEGSKTAHCPGFMHLVALVKSGIIGDVVDVKASLSKMVSPPTRELDVEQAGGSMTEHASLTLMAIIKLLGIDIVDFNFHSRMQDGVDIFTKGILNFPHATASITLGIGVKTEGNLVISGTKGYVYVPAPWWLTDYYEVRYENQTNNKKYFYSYDGDGLRYEIQEFISMIVDHRHESITIAEIIEYYRNGINVTEI